MCGTDTLTVECTRCEQLVDCACIGLHRVGGLDGPPFQLGKSTYDVLRMGRSCAIMCGASCLANMHVCTFAVIVAWCEHIWVS